MAWKMHCQILIAGKSHNTAILKGLDERTGYNSCQHVEAYYQKGGDSVKDNEQKKGKTPSTYDQVRGHTGKSYANELFAQVNDFFYEFGIINPSKKSKEPE